jgi:hypothetical protein
MKKTSTETKVKTKVPYQAPRIETSLTAQDMERELFYAGSVSSPPPPPPP